MPLLLPYAYWLNFVVSFSMTAVLVVLIFKFTPRESMAWVDVWAGALLTAALLNVGKALIGAYLGSSTFTSAYGAAGSLLVLLLWIYYSAQIFLFGAEFTCAFAYARGSRASQVASARVVTCPASAVPVKT